ncbi:MAG TPA: DNA recombination protein RmuC [Patescibacteria group bacterium]|nr:DNA recombination protein RmuC [Patescibacteria group bacterium]
MDATIVLIIVLAALLIIAIFINRKLIELREAQKPSDELLEIIRMLQTGGKEDRKVLLESLQKNTQALNERLDSAARVISAVQKNLGEMSEVGRGIKTLQEFLQSPKLRGGLGEEVLKEMIGQTFPKNAFHLQYPFKSGAKVDAVLKTEAGLLCIDSKFPMENFNVMLKGETEAERNAAKKQFSQDVKKHIEDISRKYILPEEGTMDFALMYIPSEAVYYEVVNIPELSNFARRMRVYPVSPNTLYAHLQVLLLSFEGKGLEAKSREVFRILRAIQKDYGKLDENMGTLQRHLNNAFNSMATVFSSFTQLGQKISSTQKLGSGKKE